MIGIPSEYVAKMGVYSIKIGGVQVEVKVVDIDYASVVNSQINEMRSALITGPRVVGVDFKYLNTIDEKYNRKNPCKDPHLLVLSTVANCLIVHNNAPSFSTYPYHNAIPEGLMKFLKDNDVCFVGPKSTESVLSP